ncbi:unnamed protein product, partial [Prorocentrum cordatum]
FPAGLGRPTAGQSEGERGRAGHSGEQGLYTSGRQEQEGDDDGEDEDKEKDGAAVTSKSGLGKSGRESHPVGRLVPPRQHARGAEALPRRPLAEGPRARQ